VAVAVTGVCDRVEAGEPAVVGLGMVVMGGSVDVVVAAGAERTQAARSDAVSNPPIRASGRGMVVCTSTAAQQSRPTCSAMAVSSKST
jgi:hypothetical protein